MLLSEGDREAQSTSPTRSPGWPQRQRLSGSFQALQMRCPAPPSAHPSATGTFSPSTFPMVHVGSDQSRVCRRWRQAQVNFYLPVCTERTIGAPTPCRGTQQAACRLQSPSCSRALDKTGALSWQKPHSADSARFGTVARQESCTLTAPCN